MQTDACNAIGGYFTLELPLKQQVYHKGAVAINSGKNAFEYILSTFNYKVGKVYLPFYTSRIMIKPLEDYGIPYEFYRINSQLELASEISLNKSDMLVYTNYFGLKNEYIKKIAPIYGGQLIIDNAQAFYDKTLHNVNTFYSPRKFFGVLDGGYAYSQGEYQRELPESISYDRMSYLLKRIDTSAEEAFADYKASCHLGGLPVSKMSKITSRIMGGIDYQEIARVRRENYKILDDALSKTNKFCFELGDAVPLVYPYFCEDESLRAKLIANKVYVAQYWPNVLEWCQENDLEYQLTTKVIPLPIDQRYGANEMNHIIKIIQDGRE